MPGKMAEMEKAVGQKVDVEIKTDTMDITDVMAVHDTFGTRMVDALKALCKDDLAKQAFIDGVKKVEVYGVANDSDKKMELKDGTFSVWGKWGSSSDGYFAFSDYKKFLEANL